MYISYKPGVYPRATHLCSKAGLFITTLLLGKTDQLYTVIQRMLHDNKNEKLFIST